MQPDLYRPRIKAWLDGELSAAQAAEMERHALECADCRLIAENYRQISARLKSFSALDVRVPAPGVIRARARKIQLKEARVIRILRRVAAIAALFLITTSGLATWFYWQSDDDVSASDEIMLLVLSN